MKLKALVYQQKEWNPLQLSTDFPVFPVENITEEALAVWKLHAEEVLLITPTDAGIQAAVRAHMAVAAYADPAFPEQSYAGAWMQTERGFRDLLNHCLQRKKKKYISRHILPICTDTMDMGCGWFLIKLLGN